MRSNRDWSELPPNKELNRFSPFDWGNNIDPGGVTRYDPLIRRQGRYDEPSNTKPRAISVLGWQPDTLESGSDDFDYFDSGLSEKRYEGLLVHPRKIRGKQDADYEKG